MFVEEMVDLAPSSAPLLVTATFDKRTVLETEIALTKACETLPCCLDNHENRCVIAKRILGALMRESVPSAGW